MEDLGKALILVGIVLAIIGGAIFLISKIPGAGQLPGDIAIQRDGFSCFLPLVSSIILSIVLTIVLNLLLRVLNR
ncbi:MAG: DUF2905 domain-containing protein [Chloroflexi bacterium]|nr:DUF2905 domain-containing protein [Chloroflexota bacterium]